MTANSGDGLTSRHLQVLEAIGRRALFSVPPSALDMSLSWEDLVIPVLDARRERLIDAGRASEELETLLALARSAGEAAALNALGERFYAAPLLRDGLRRLIAAPDPGLPGRVGKIIDRLEAVASRAPPPHDALAQLSEPAAGVRPSAAAARSGTGSFEPVTPADLRALRDHFRGGRDPVDLVFAENINPLTDLAASVVAEASWATGLRPCEWPEAKLVVECGGPRAESVETLFDDALESSQPPPPSRRWDWLAHLRSLLLGQMQSGAAWLEVRTRKAGHARRQGLPDTRRLGLGNQPDALQVAVFCTADLAARLDRRGEWDAWQRRINRRLKSASQRLFPSRRRPITLYSFRHDFIDRAKGAGLCAEEIGALAGHSSRRSKAHYGRPAAHASGGGVMPVPDPEHVARLREHERSRRAVRRASGRDAGPERSPDPSPSPG